MSLRLYALDAEQRVNVADAVIEIAHCPEDMRDTDNRCH
jgi:hypothetical protein